MGPQPRVAIIGAGAGGLALAIKFKQQLGYNNFTIYEQGDDVGGTWRVNIYPGCSSDVPMVFYSLSTDNHDWPHSHGYWKDIQEYWKQLTKKYTLYGNIQFNTKVIRANWNDSSKIYHIFLQDVNTGECRTVDAEILVSAIGVLEVPRYAKIPGVANFKGEMFHSARWNYNVDLRNKKVAVIGNGASATQFVPCITEDPTVQVTEFCRTPNWFLPPIRSTHSTFRRWISRNIPFVQMFWRWVMFLRLEVFYATVFGNGFLRQLAMALGRWYIRKTAPEEYHDELLPRYPMGCKRVIFDTGFLNALHQPNLKLNWTSISEIVEDGIITKSGEKLLFDVIIFATGYAADEFPLSITGTQGSIQEYFKEKEGPQAYLGTTFPYFPNFFTILGPNTATGHTSVIFTNEVQADYIIQLVKPILECRVASVEVKSEPTDAYNFKIQKRLKKSVFVHCLSWYRFKGKGKITNIFPGAGLLFWLWLRRPKWEHYTGLGLEEWAIKKRKEKRLKDTCLASVLIVSAVGLAYLHSHIRG